ncbi:MAG: hypothetical protein WBE77_10980 [Candidatus Cybelea sp.]
MRTLLALGALAALAACAGAPTSPTFPSSTSTLQQQAAPLAVTCRYKRFFVDKSLLRADKVGAIVHAYRPNEYVSFAVWNHLHESSVNVWPTNDKSAQITVAPMTQTKIMKLASPVKSFVVQKVTRGVDSGSGVELNGTVCPQS